MKKILSALLTAIFLLPALCFAQNTGMASNADVIKLMEVTQTKEITSKIMDQTKIMLQQELSSNPEALAMMNEIFNEYNIDQLLQLLIPVYEKHLSKEEINGAINFFDSSSGRKLTSAMPMITQEVMQTVYSWYGSSDTNETQSAETNAVPKLSPKEDRIHKILTLNGVVDNITKLEENMNKAKVQNPKAHYPAKFNKTNLIKMYIDVFGKHLDDKTVNDTLTYYSSPLGRQYISKQVSIQAESSAITTDYTNNLLKTFTTKMENMQNTDTQPEITK